MNKNIKKVIAVALTIAAFSTVTTTGLLQLNSQDAYAASYHAKSDELDTLSIKSTNGKELDLRCDDFQGRTVDLNHDTEYYVRLNDSSEGIKINAEPNDDDQIVKVFLSDNGDATPCDTNKKIYLSKGESTIYLRVYDSKDDFKEAKKDKDYTKCENTYTIHVLKTNSSSNEDISQDAIYLSSLEVSKVKNLNFLKTTTRYTGSVKSYVKNIEIIAKPEEKSSKVFIDGTEVGENEGYKRTVSLKNGENDIKIKVIDSNYKVRVYTLKVSRGDGSDTEDDDIYLRDLTLDDGDIDLAFDEDETSYTKTVDKDVRKIKIAAEPDKEEYLVTIDGEEVFKSDDYERKVSLSEGKNVIPIVVKDEENNLTRTYKLTINRGKIETTTETTTDTNSGTNSDIKEPEKTYDAKNDPTVNGPSNINANSFSTNWVKDSVGYQYKKDNTVLKNQWILDEVSNKYYIVDENGYRKHGWIKWSGTWYLLDNNGVMLTGWQKDNGKWYYLNPVSDGTQGAMLTGWVKDTDGTWYYMNGDGSMNTGWLQDSNGTWYYLDASGAMHTGWLTDGNSKYYLNSPNGDMAVGSKNINGKTYYFNGSGALNN